MTKQQKATAFEQVRVTVRAIEARYAMQQAQTINARMEAQRTYAKLTGGISILK